MGDDGVEFFVHSPFAWRKDPSTVEDRNRDSLVMQATFEIGGVQTRFILGSDIDHFALSDIVTITRNHKRVVRLMWDVFKLPHHCSYLSLGPDRGTDKTKPVEEVKWLFESQGQEGCYVVSSSKAIPKKGSVEDKDVLPPHRQAAAYYEEDVAGKKNGEFKVTMEYPNAKKPEPIEIEITGCGAKLVKRAVTGVAAITTNRALRAG